MLIADPPFLNADTQGKVARTARLLAKPDAKFLLCTGESIAEEARRMYGEPPLEKLELVVEHHGLANAFGIWGSRLRPSNTTLSMSANRRILCA